MVPRVTQQGISRAALSSIRQSTAKLSTTQEQLATGRRLNRLSDDPLAAARAHRIRAHRTRFEQHQRSIEQAHSETDFAGSALQEAADLLIEARDIAMRAAGSAVDPLERETLAYGVERLLETLVLRANISLNGRHPFAGNASEAAPYRAETAAGQITAVIYEGGESRTELEIGPRSRVPVGAPGTEVFAGEVDAFEALIELRGLLRNEGGLSEGELSAAISGHIGVIDTAYGQVVDAAARFGWTSNQLEFTRTVLENATLADTATLSEIEDADMAVAAANLVQQETVLQTALAVSARLMQNTLMDYLK